jgi:hypothetical protein
MWPAASPSWAIRIKNRFSAGYKKPSEIIGFNHRTGASYYLPIYVCTLPLATVYLAAPKTEISQKDKILLSNCPFQICG